MGTQHQDLPLDRGRTPRAQLTVPTHRPEVHPPGRGDHPGMPDRAVGVSPGFYDRAVQALEDIEDIRAAAAARQETGGISQEDLRSELGLDWSAW